MKIDFESNVWFYIERAEDIPGEWVSHCLDFDVVMQGRSLQEAFETLIKSMRMIVIDDIKAGRDPHERRAPKSEWDRFWAEVAGAQKRPPGEPLPADDSNVQFFAAQLLFTVHEVEKPKRGAKKKKEAEMQMPLALAGYSERSAA